jgi:acetyl esterase/lipase
MGWQDWLRHGALFGCVILGLAGLPARAVEGGPIPAEIFFKHPTLLGVKLSPSGRYLGMTSVRDNRRVALLVVDLQTTEPAKVVAFFAKQDVVDFHWVNDGRMLFSLGQIEPAKTFTHRSGLFAVDIHTLKQVELICSEINSCRQQSGALRINHELLSVPSATAGLKPDEVIAGRFDWRRGLVEPMWLDTTATLLRRMDLPTLPERAQDWWFDRHGQARLVRSVFEDDGRGAYHWLAPGSKEWRQLASFRLMDPPFSPVAVTKDGRLYVTEARGPAREAVLTTFDFETGRPAAQPIVQVPGFDFAGSLVLDDSEQEVLGVNLHGDSQVTVWTDPAMKAFQAMVDKRFPGRVNSIDCRHCGRPDMLALVLSYADRDPGRYLLYRAETQRWETVAVVMPDVKPSQMATVDFQRVQARDGRDLPVWFTLPPGVARGKPAPTVVLTHGGPWVRNGYWHWEAMAQFLASRGYLVIEPEFRGSTGYGEAHYKAGFKQWGQAMQDDLADALLWARKAGLASDRACLMGASYGGYATAMGLVRHPDLFRCGISSLGVADLLLLVEGSFWTDDDIGRLTRHHAYPELIGDPTKDATALAAVSPVLHAARIQAPMLLAYGERDYRVPKEHGRRLRDALTKAGNPPEYVEYENEGHGWQHMTTRLDFARRVETFLARHLREATP